MKSQKGPLFKKLLALALLILFSCQNLLVAQALTPVAHEYKQVTAAPGGLGVRLINIPSDVLANPLSTVYIVNHLLPSTVVYAHLELSNTTKTVMVVNLYPGAATNIKGNFLPTNPGITNDLTSWTSVTPSTAVIPANGYVSVTVKIMVPDVVLPGERFGLIWASIGSSSNPSALTTVNRVGIRMYLPVGAISG